MIKKISTCIGVRKKKHKVLLLDFVSRLWSFSSLALVEHWLYIWLLLYASVLAKIPQTRLHIRETRQWPIFSIQITQHYKNLDSTLFMSKVVAHHTVIALISPPSKPVQKQSTGKHHVHFLLKRCEIHFFKLKLELNITFFLNLVYTSASLTSCAICMQRILGARLISFLQTWGEQRTLGAWKGRPTCPVLFVSAQKTNKFQFVASGMRTIRWWRSTGSQSHPHIHAFGPQTVREQFMNHSMRLFIRGFRMWHVWGCGTCKILWPRHMKLCIFGTVNIHNTNQLNTFALFPDAETWRWQHGVPLPFIRVGTLFRDHDGHGHLWMVK